MPEVDLGIDAGLAGTVEKFRNEGKGVSVLLADAVESLEVDAESERSIFLSDEENWGSVRRHGLPDESRVEVFVKKFAKGLLLECGERIDRTRRDFHTFLEFNLEIVRAMRSERVGLGVAEYFSKFVVFGGDRGEVDDFGGFGGCGSEVESELSRAW